MADNSQQSHPRPITVIIAVLGLDQHEVGAVAVSRLLRDAGMNVIYLGRFQLPSHIVAAALEEDADVIGISVHSSEYRYYLDELINRLQQVDLSIPLVIGGSILTDHDADVLRRKGISAVFPASASGDKILYDIEAAVTARREDAGTREEV